MSVEITQIKEKITEIKRIKFILILGLWSMVYLCPLGYGLWSITASAQESGYAFKLTDRDPFSPLVSKSGALLIPREVDLGGLAIRGIIYSKESPVAIINDEVVERGENLGDYLVLDIEEKRVILKKGDQEFILKLEEEEE